MAVLEFCGTPAGPLQKNIQTSKLGIIFSGVFLFLCLLACLLVSKLQTVRRFIVSHFCDSS